MKKKFLSLILVLMLIPFASLFCACGADDGYDLDNLEKDFSKITNQTDTMKLEEGELVFDYSSYPNVQNAIENTDPYTSLSNYNYVFENLMKFSCSYIDECSNNKATSDVKIKNEIKENLDELSKSMKDVDECLDMFAEMINVSQSNLTQTACLTRYKNLITTYENMYQRAINFSNALSNLYYNHVLKDGNPNIYAISFSNFDANIVVTKLESRIKYQLSNLSQSYVEMYIGGELAEKVVSQEEIFDLTQYNYLANVTALNKQIESIQVASEKANHNDNRLNFYNLSIEAQNIQETLNNDQRKFVEACNAIDYKTVKNNASATAYEKMCGDIIESNHSLVLAYNNVLTEMLNIVTN